MPLNRSFHRSTHSRTKSRRSARVPRTRHGARAGRNTAHGQGGPLRQGAHEDREGMGPHGFVRRESTLWRYFFDSAAVRKIVPTYVESHGRVIFQHDDSQKESHNNLIGIALFPVIRHVCHPFDALLFDALLSIVVDAIWQKSMFE